MSAMYEPIQGICMPDLYVTRRIRRAKIIFSMFLTFSLPYMTEISVVIRQ